MLECQVMTESQARIRGVNLIFPATETSHFVKADRIRVHKVLSSLLSHAINHSKAGEAVVVDYDVRNPECIRFCIQDGGGLSAEKSVGMVLSKRLVEMMGGIIGVSSSVGTSRVLWFELKRIVDPPTAGSPSTYPSFVQAGDSNAGMQYRAVSRQR